MAKEIIRIPIDDGKYTFIVYDNDWRIHCLRYDESWMIFERGHKAIFSLLYEFDEMKRRFERLKCTTKSDD